MVAERVDRPRQVPREHSRRVVGSRHHCGIVADGERRAIEAPQTVLAQDLPVVCVGFTVVQDAGKQPFGSRPVTRCTRLCVDGNEVLRARQDEGVLRIVVTRNALRRRAADAGNAQAPTEAERAVAITRAVEEVELRLQPGASGRYGKRDGEVACACVQVWSERLPDSSQRAAARRESDDLT